MRFPFFVTPRRAAAAPESPLRQPSVSMNSRQRRLIRQLHDSLPPMRPTTGLPSPPPWRSNRIRAPKRRFRPSSRSRHPEGTVSAGHVVLRAVESGETEVTVEDRRDSRRRCTVRSHVDAWTDYCRTGRGVERRARVALRGYELRADVGSWARVGTNPGRSARVWSRWSRCRRRRGVVSVVAPQRRRVVLGIYRQSKWFSYRPIKVSCQGGPVDPGGRDGRDARSHHVPHRAGWPASQRVERRSVLESHRHQVALPE